MRLEFMPNTESYDVTRDIVRFLGWDGERWVSCGVRRDALIDTAGAAAASGVDPVKLYRTHIAPIHTLANAKYQRGRFESDGLVLVRSVDLDP
jgi:hypothetical protein